MVRFVHIKNKVMLYAMVAAIVGLGIAFAFGPKRPKQRVNTTDTALKHANGVLFYKEKEFSGEVITLAENGDTIKKESYVNGKLDGESVKWYGYGVLEETRYYHLGRKAGTHTGYWPDRSKRFEYHFENDLAEGNQKDWTENGMLWRDFNYKNGQEDGLQRMWYENGKLRMNYQIINGRRYGLQGVKNCNGVSEK